MFDGNPSLNRARLAKLLGMLGSQHDGEVLAAARQVERLRAEAGLTWFQLLGVMPDDDLFAFLHANADLLTPWERRFVASLVTFAELSDRQRGVLDQIVRKCRLATEEADHAS